MTASAFFRRVRMSLMQKTSNQKTGFGTMRIMDITQDQEERLRELMGVFLLENKKLNLSAYRTEEQCWHGNVLDSVVGIQKGEFGKGMRVLDCGTGGGFPLLPLAILFPIAEFTGLDATKKKIDAVQRMIAKLGLRNAELIIGRAEEMGREQMFREQFDVVLSRAVAPLSTLLEYMSPFVRVGGTLICWKSLSIEEELVESIQARMQLKTRLTGRTEYVLPGDWGKRQLLFFQKTAALTN